MYSFWCNLSVLCYMVAFPNHKVLYTLYEMFYIFVLVDNNCLCVCDTMWYFDLCMHCGKVQLSKLTSSSPYQYTSFCGRKLKTWSLCRLKIDVRIYCGHIQVQLMVKMYSSCPAEILHPLLLPLPLISHLSSVSIILTFKDSTYKRDHTVFEFLFVSYIT